MILKYTRFNTYKIRKIKKIYERPLTNIKIEVNCNMNILK